MSSSSLHPRNWRAKSLIAAAVLALAAIAVWAVTRQPAEPAPPATTAAAASAGRPALTVSLATAQHADWPRALVANGNIAAWQEAVIGAEISNYRLTEVHVNVGDMVRKGQLLARISDDNVAAELAQTRAALAEAQATLAEARANAERARRLQNSGALSAQQITQYLTAEQTAAARVTAAQAKMEARSVAPGADARARAR